jgi:hypothetical protein
VYIYTFTNVSFMLPNNNCIIKTYRQQLHDSANKSRCVVNQCKLVGT